MPATPSPRPATASLLLLTLALGATACTRTVVGGGGEGGDDAESAGSGDAPPTVPPGSTGGPTGGAGGGSSALSFLGTGLEAAGLGVPCDEPCPRPDMLFLAIDSRGQTCAAPGDATATDSPGWFLIVGLPPTAQALGEHVVDETFVTGGTLIDSGPGSIAVSSGGAGGRGTVEITALDATEVRFTLRGMSGLAEVDGDYVAPHCNPYQPPAEPAGEGGAGGAPSGT